MAAPQYIKIWAENGQADYDFLNRQQFVTDTQRQNGFQPDTVASAIRVNSALKEATLIATALVNLLPDGAKDSISLEMNLTQATAILGQLFSTTLTDLSFNPETNILSFSKGIGEHITTSSIDLSSLRGTKWFRGTDLETNDLGVVWYTSENAELNDFYLITQTYAGSQIIFNKGDLYQINSKENGFYILTFVMNIQGG